MNYPSWQREIASYLIKAVIFIIVIVIIGSLASVTYRGATMIGDGVCNIAVFPLEGIILPFDGITDTSELSVSPRLVRNFIRDAEAELGIEAILFEINSPGGTPVAAEWMADSIRASELPTVALIGDIGASGGYMAASAADHIVASVFSEIGSIGVTMSYLDESQRNENEGVSFVELAAGKYKDAGNPNRALTEEERDIFQQQLDTIHDEFIALVSENRQLDPAQVRSLADGSTLLGRSALEAGLVDTIGGRSEAKAVLARILEKEEADIHFCEYIPALW